MNVIGVVTGMFLLLFSVDVVVVVSGVALVVTVDPLVAVPVDCAPKTRHERTSGNRRR